MAIRRNEALECLQSDDLIGIGMEADAIRRRLHPDGIVTYTLDAAISYNDPAADADTSPAPATPFLESIYREIASRIAHGATSVTLHGQVPANRQTLWFQQLFRKIKEQFPTLWLHSLSATEILHLATNSSQSIYDTIDHLREAGLDSIPGHDAGILAESDWLTIHRTAHKLGVQTTASLHFGSGETLDQRINHLESIRNLQEETNGFASFTPHPTAIQGLEEATAVEYLRTLAVSRIYLDTIPNIQSSLKTQGLKVLQVALRFGSNDAGSILLAQAPNAASEEQVRHAIRDAGFRPMQRDALYRTMFLN